VNEKMALQATNLGAEHPYDVVESIGALRSGVNPATAKYRYYYYDCAAVSKTVASDTFQF
jgi:hypothetical protein